MSNSPKIYWHYQYIENGREVKEGEDIVLIPDHLGRWQLEGSIKISTDALPDLELKAFADYLMVPIAWVNQRDCKTGEVPSIAPDDRFASKFACFHNSLSFGFGETYFYGKTPGEVVGKIQSALEKTMFMFINAYKR